MTSNEKIVAVTYCADRPGQTRLAYAADLAQLTNSSLLLVLPLPDNCRRSPDDDRAAGKHRFRLDAKPFPANVPVSVLTGDVLGGINEMASNPSFSMIAVVTDDEPIYGKLVRIASKDESRVFRSEKKEILLPFGPGDASLRVLEAVQPFAASLGASIRLYHTTWRNDSVKSNDVRDHMRPDVLQVFDQLQTKGPFAVTLETAAEVDAGINLAALTNGSSFIAMTRGRRVVRGGYMHWVTVRSSVPTIIVP